MAGISPRSILKSPTLVLLLVIVVTSVSMMAAGFGTPPPATDTNESKAPFGGVDGNSGGDGNDGGDGTDDVPLSLSLNRTELRPGGSVQVTVRAGGDPVPDALVSVRGDTYRTDASGSTVVRFPAGGQATLEATKASDETDYRPATASVRVRRYVVDLDVSANATRATAGDAVAVTVHGPNGTLPATVTVDGTTRRTGTDGVAVFRLERAGAVTISATKASNETTRYRRAETDLAVDRRTVALSATVRDDDVVAGDRPAVVVRRADTGEAVAGANVTLDGVRYRTDAEGVATVPVERARTATLVASAAPTAAVRFTDDRVTVDVRRRAVPLSLSASRVVVDSGGTVTFQVNRSDTDAPVNATVSLAEGRYVTGPDGRVNVTLEGYGRKTARVTRQRTPAERYVPDSVSVTALAPDVVVGNLSVPANATAGEPVVVSGTVSNVGNADATSTLALLVDNETLATRSVTLEPGDSERVRVAATLPAGTEPGEATVELVETDPVVGSPDGASATLTVLAPRFTVGDVSAPTSSQPGETIAVNATVRNSGTAAGETVVAYELDGETLASREVSLSPGAIERVRFTVTVPSDLADGTYRQSLTTADDETSLSLQVARDDATALRTPGI